MRLVRLNIAMVAFALVVSATGCDDPVVPSSSFYDERIQPILQVGCAQQLNGCHVDQNGRATGNLDLSSFDALMQRRDVLPSFGPYTNGVLLLKGGEPITMNIEVWDPDPISGTRNANVVTDVRHAAGQLLETGSPGQRELKRWIEESTTRTGVADETLAENQGECSERDAVAYGFDPDAMPESETFGRFTSGVEQVLMNRCAGGSCHGTTVADFYLKCADGGANTRWNYYVTLSHITDIAPSRSGLLRRPLSEYRGGTYHEGGNVIGSTEDPDYQTLFDFVNFVAENHPELLQDPSTDRGIRFFANRVQPVLARKGCMFLNCHSNAMFHDLRLRTGDQGVFSRIATHKNHEISRMMLALESPDPNDSRLIGKNLFAREGPSSALSLVGIDHRGGSLFEDFGVRDTPPDYATDCAGFDADTGDLNEVPAYCIFSRWHQIEREEAIARGDINPDTSLVDSIVWVSRPAGVGGVRDFDTFRGGADLRTAPAIVAADGSVSLGGSSSLLASCPVGAGADVRNPTINWQATEVAFAARAAASDPLRIYRVNVDGSGCELYPGIDAGAAMGNGILIHDFDPAYAADDRLVFASTRGNLDAQVSYDGPTRTPASDQPNANMYIQDADGSVRQLTFLLNQEVSPAFMLDGRLIMTGEKREPDFHQLALRRENLDGGDYHPLFAQRESVGFRSGTEVIELPNRNFMFVASHLPCPDVSPCSNDGAGALMMVNRSIGPDQDDRAVENDYIHSMYLTAPGAFGSIQNVPQTPLTNGVYRSPSPLPNGRVIAACGDGDLSGAPQYTLCQIDVFSGNRTDLGGEPGMANVEPVAVMRRPRYPVFVGKPDEANGSSRVYPDRSDRTQITVEDFPLLATLLFSNTREGRQINYDIGGVRVFEALPPEVAGGEMVSDAFGSVYRNYRDLGFVPMFSDGSLAFVIPGGIPIVLQPTDDDGNALMFGEGDPFTGPIIQREQMQFYPGEVISQSFQREFFNGLCGTCHGSISGRELDSAVNVDILTSASQVAAADRDPIDLR